MKGCPQAYCKQNITSSWKRSCGFSPMAIYMCMIAQKIANGLHAFSAKHINLHGSVDLKIRLIQAAIDCISVEYCCEFFFGADVYFGDSASLGQYPSAVCMHLCTLIILLIDSLIDIYGWKSCTTEWRGLYESAVRYIYISATDHAFYDYTWRLRSQKWVSAWRFCLYSTHF